MYPKKFINLYILSGIIFSIIISKFLWAWIEIDYVNEIKNINIFEKIFKFNKSVNIPKIYRSSSTKRLITMSWLEGQSLDNIFLNSKNKKELTLRLKLPKILHKKFTKKLHTT